MTGSNGRPSFKTRALTISRTEAAVGVVVRSGKSGMACGRP
jgi:hypothetical protein